MTRAVRLALCLLIGFVAACSDDAQSPDAGAALDASSVADSGASIDGGADASVLPDASADAAVDAGMPLDSGPPMDSGSPMDAGTSEDAAVMDAEAVDATEPDASTPDATAADASTPDATAADAQPMDATAVDAGPIDSGVIDTGVGDTGFADATTRDAAPIDGGPQPACDVVVNLPETNAGQVGGNGGSPGPFLECAAGEEIIGVAARISDGSTSNNGRSAVGLSIICAAVVLDPTGPIVGQETVHEVMGSGQFGWTPATQSTLTRCPPGWLMSGLSASRGTTGNRFLDITLSCRALSSTGMTTGATQDIYVVGSQVEAGVRDTVACAAGEVVRRVGTRVGAGFDAASLFCAAPVCAP